VKPFLASLKAFFLSLRLTVILLTLSMILVFVATLDQVNLGIWAVQEKFFRSGVVYWTLPSLGLALPVFPGGYTLGGLLLINLVCAHLFRLTLSWRKLGLQMAHGGLILLLVGELLTGLWQRESFLRLDEGETKSYSEAYTAVELALVDVTDPAEDAVVIFPEELLAKKPVAQHPALPFRVAVRAYFPNASVERRRNAAPNSVGPVATQGAGVQLALMPLPITFHRNERNTPAALVELTGTEGSLGTWMASIQLVEPQRLTHQGRTWEIGMRPKRTYHPFSLRLLRFSHDKYPGTEIPRNFSSRVRLRSDDGRDDREVTILMNSPLRHAGVTLYQAGFDNNDTTSILQVVRNPSWLLPYISCAMLFVGLMIEFGLSLAGHLRKRAGPVRQPA
jgi:hypothetical protein